MDDHSHFFFEESAEIIDYRGVGGGRAQVPERDEHQHADIIERQYRVASEAFNDLKESLPNNVEPVQGLYTIFYVDERAQSLKSLDTKSGARILNLHQETDSNIAKVSVYIPQRNQRWLNRKLAQYRVEPQEQGQRRKNRAFVNSIEQVDRITLQDFFPENISVEHLPQDRVLNLEMWVLKTNDNENRICETLDLLGVGFYNRHLVFEEVYVYLINASRDQLMQIIGSIEFISEFRPYYSPSALLDPQSLNDEREFLQLIGQDMIIGDRLTRIGVLDSGVNNAHPLIEPLLPDDRCLSVIGDGLNVRDLKNHGTGVASLALFGDLTSHLYNPEHYEVISDLVSVKIMPGDREEPNNPEYYPIINEDAIVQSRNNGAIILCSAITNKIPAENGTPSATSSAIDQVIYNGGNCDSLYLISSGNTDENNGLDYPDYLYNAVIHDPAQSWNALSIGAYTEKDALQDNLYKGLNIVAPVGGIAPHSSTSVQFGANQIIKPEILMEGGNSVLSNNQLDDPDELQLVVANAKMVGDLNYFCSFNATSASVGLAANLAARILHHNPQISPLSVRALMVHSAHWTEKMIEMCTKQDGGIDMDLLVHSCGYGVPDEKAAIVSSDNYATFINEGVITPFKLGTGSDLKFASMHLYRLPWPEDVLRGMEDDTVELKITLSYYIDPSPVAKNSISKYVYQSIRLKFDVNMPTENEGSFKRRISHMGDDDIFDNDASRWTIGINRRNQGCVISDSIAMSAIDATRCNLIAVYPASGWYKYKKAKVDAAIKYSLVVSLKTPEQDIYTEIAQRIGIVVPASV